MVQEKLHSVEQNVAKLEHITPIASRLARFRHHVPPSLPYALGPGATKLRHLQHISGSAKHPLDAMQTLVFPGANEAETCIGIRSANEARDQVIAALVMVTFDRADYANRTLESLLTAHGHHPDNRSGKRVIGVHEIVMMFWCMVADTMHLSSFFQASVSALRESGWG